MNCIRIPSALASQIREDLRRPHHLAWERIGFLFTRHAANAGSSVILASNYVPVPDAEYLPTLNSAIGARFGSKPIRDAMQRILDTKEGVFHVHEHPPGHLTPSPTDLRSLSELLPAFHTVGPALSHGALILDERTIAGYLWSQREGTLNAIDVTVVGLPMLFHGAQRNE